jgi:hypothetical protein
MCHDTKIGAIISKLWTPMTLTEERRLKPTAVGGGAPPHGSGGQPTPHALAQRAGRARSCLTRASPPQAGHGPHEPRPGRAPRPCSWQRAAAPRVGQPRIAALRVAPQPGGSTEGRPGGAGAHDLVATPPPLVRPAMPHLWARPPNFGASVVYTARPAQRLKKTIGAA